MFGDGYVVCVVRVHWSRDIDGLVVELACSDFKQMKISLSFFTIRSLVVKFIKKSFVADCTLIQVNLHVSLLPDPRSIMRSAHFFACS